MEFQEEAPRPATDEANDSDKYADLTDEQLTNALDKGIDPFAEPEADESLPEGDPTPESQDEPVEQDAPQEAEQAEQTEEEPEQEDPQIAALRAEFNERLEEKELEIERVRLQHDKVSGRLGQLNAELKRRQEQRDDYDLEPTYQEPQQPETQKSFNALEDPTFRQDHIRRVASEAYDQMNVSEDAAKFFPEAVKRVGEEMADDIAATQDPAYLDSLVRHAVRRSVLEARSQARKASMAEEKEKGAKRAQEVIARKKAASVTSRGAAKPQIADGPKPLDQWTDEEIEAELQRAGGRLAT